MTEAKLERRSPRRARISEVFLRHIESLGIEVFRNRQHEAFVSFPPLGGGLLTFPLRSSPVKQRLRREYHRHTDGRLLPKESLDEVLDALEANTIDTPEREVYLRVAGHEGKVFIDLGRPDNRVVRIAPGEWSLTTDCPVRFYRPAGFGELPVPIAGKSMSDLQKQLNLEHSSWVLLSGFLLNCLNPNGPRLGLLVEGEQGGGKSLTCNFIKRIIDPTRPAKLRLPRSEHDLMIQCGDNWLPVFDNTSSMKNDISDALCTLCTGAGFSTRRFYTDNESRIFDFCRSFVSNGIGGFANRPDLLERCIRLKLPAISAENRRTERELVAAFEELLPGILGRLYDAVAHALKYQDKVTIPATVRMADAAQWISAGEAAFGFPEGAFLEAFEDVQADMLSERAADDPLVSAISTAVGRRPGRVLDDTIGNLLTDLRTYAGQYEKRLPPTPARLSTELKRLKPAMTTLGIEVEFTGRTKKGTHVRITMVDEDRTGEFDF